MAARGEPSNVDENLRLIEYLSTDLLYLRRFVLATKHMIKLARTEHAHDNPEMQEKLVSTIELAKETLAEAGVSARPFIPCRQELVEFKEAYYDMLVAFQPLVQYVNDSQTRLRLRRLLLPLSSTSCFRLNLPSDDSDDDRSNHDHNACDPQPPTWWSEEGDMRVFATSDPSLSLSDPAAEPPSVLVLPGTPTKKVRVKSPKVKAQPIPPCNQEPGSDWEVITEVPIVPSSPQRPTALGKKHMYSALARKKRVSARKSGMRAYKKLSFGVARMYAGAKAKVRATKGKVKVATKVSIEDADDDDTDTGLVKDGTRGIEDKPGDGRNNAVAGKDEGGATDKETSTTDESSATTSDTDTEEERWAKILVPSPIDPELANSNEEPDEFFKLIALNFADVRISSDPNSRMDWSSIFESKPGQLVTEDSPRMVIEASHVAADVRIREYSDMGLVPLNKPGAYAALRATSSVRRYHSHEDTTCVVM